MIDETESIRRGIVSGINGAVISLDAGEERARLERYWKKVWSTDDLSRDFEVLGFAAPFVVVVQRSTGEQGSLMFQDRPRFYFGWKADRRSW